MSDADRAPHPSTARAVEECHEHRLESPKVNVPIGPYVVDFLWPHHRLIAEADGVETHATRAGFERDRIRDAELTAADCRVVRFTHRRIMDEQRAVARTLHTLLHRRPSE